MSNAPELEPDAPARRFFEDLPVGSRWVSPRRTLTEADITNFAGISGDFNPLHVDEVSARRTVFGRRVAHGALVFAVATGLRHQLGIFQGSLKALLEIRSWKFVKPVFAGDTVLAVTTIESARETTRCDQGIIVQRVEVVNQDGDVVQHGELVSLVRRKASPRA